jgi:competence protein ComEC
MARNTAIIILALLVPLAAPSATISTDAAPCARVRVAPRANAARIDCIAPGTTVAIIASSPYWRQVQYGNNTGWVAKKYVTETSAATPPAADQWLEVHIIDVGQGDGIWIRTPDDGVANGQYEGKNIIIDGGPDSSDANNALYAYLQQYAHPGAVIDALLITHPHTDHYRGAKSLVRHYDIRDIYDPGYPKGGTEYPAFKSTLVSKSGATTMLGLTNFTPLQWGTELDASILYGYGSPGADLGTASNTMENNASIVVRLQYGNHVFLFMGDAEGKDRADDPGTARYAEEWLLGNIPAARLKATVLKIAHHGSETSSTQPFISAVDPEILVVSSGRKRFGSVYLPDRTTLRRYCCHNPNIRIYRTDQDDEAEGRTETTDADGDHIIIRTNGTTMTITAHSNGVPITADTCQPPCE